ncbi:hypothetical protein MUG87_18690 [Ectobacillus sp. JY-23]|nr:hypothetical protein [Ectobacillus sp. JY-23]UOY92422.1 hypothetical protein MUG87_18690 [Ectobacillus sp. JY-23]
MQTVSSSLACSLQARRRIYRPSYMLQEETLQKVKFEKQQYRLKLLQQS